MGELLHSLNTAESFRSLLLGVHIGACACTNIVRYVICWVFLSNILFGRGKMILLGSRALS